jgi:hypothetical protein
MVRSARCSRKKGPVELDLRPVRQAHELEIGPPDPARQRDPLFQVRLGLVESSRPGLTVADFDQRKRAQLIVQARPRRVRGPGQGLQPLRLLGHRLQVPVLASQQQLDHSEEHLRLPAPALRHRRRAMLGQP